MRDHPHKHTCLYCGEGFNYMNNYLKHLKECEQADWEKKRIAENESRKLKTKSIDGETKK